MSRKLLTLVLASCLILSLGAKASAADNVSVALGGLGIVPDAINGLDAQVGHVNAYTYTLSYEADVNWGAATLGMILYSPDGSLAGVNWTQIPGVMNDFANAAIWNLVAGAVTPGVDAFDGTLPSTFMVGGVALGTPGSGYGPQASTPQADFVVTFTGVDGGILCLDSAFFPPAGEWLSPPATPGWSGGGGDLGVTGSRSSAFCVTTYIIPDLPPTVVDCPGVGATTSHCDAYGTTVSMVDPDVADNDPITYSGSHDGNGILTVGAASGVVQYVPGAGDGTVTITINGSEQGLGPDSDCIFTVDVTNNAPALICPPNIAVAKGNSGTSPAASGSDADACDALVYSWVSTVPAPTGTVSVDPSTGAVTFDAAVADALLGADTDYAICISVTDGIDVVECCMTITVLNTEPFCVSIDQTDKTDPNGFGSLQGHQVDVCLNFEGGSNEVGGFDFLIDYDASALSFVGASEGNIFADYEWEYFTFRFGPNGNCTGGCPSGKLRVIGLAEQNDGMHHPTSTALVAGDEFACLTFLVSNDRNLECQYVPIRWCWVDCGDNSLSSPGGDTLYVSRNVFDYIGTDNANIVSGMRADITGADQTFPTLTGAPDVCDVETEKGAPVRFVDFKNGGVRIVCADEIDDRGDINLNGLSNEIADAVMLTEYFVSGLSAFGTHIEGSIAASEVNGDGIPLTVADLVYLIRVIVGDALALPKLVHNTEAITITSKDGVVSSSADMGAALFVFDGIANVTLLADNMTIKTGVVDGNTHALVYNAEVAGAVIANGDVLATTGTLVSVEAADYNGVALSPSLETVMPTSFAVHQNYPNPFNPNTKISFDLPNASKYSVRIYNVAGQLVNVINGDGVVGTVEVDVDLSSSASGIYFYKVTAGQFSATKKMVLLK